MRRLMFAAAIAAAGAVSLAPTPTYKFALPAGCALPFAGIAPAADPYAACDVAGEMSGHVVPARAKMLESESKNNFCADESEIVPMHFADFSRLESSTDRSTMDLRHSRDDLKVIEDVIVHGHEVGEGTVVRFVAMMRGAHISDCSRPRPGKTGGEAVNCNTLGPDKNDIHIVLMPLDAGPDASECESVTAEIIPHFRPETWATLDLNTPTANPVRLTGQLFYDNSHRACVDGKGSPARRTVWEIHPVYSFDVCKGTTDAECGMTDESAWVPYDHWVQQPGVTTMATGKKQRQACESAVRATGE